MPKLLIWAPFRGNVGTIESVKNYAKIFSELGYEVVFIELCDEWSDLNQISDSYKIRSLTSSVIFKNIGKTNFFHRRDFFIFQFIKVWKLSRLLKEENPDLMISFLGIVPAIIANYFQLIPHWGSIQGFPRFLNNRAQKNLYYKFEDWLRKVLWLLNYRKLDKVLCMTPKTSVTLRNFLEKETFFVPNPLFSEGDNLNIKFDKTKSFDFIFIGRNSYQKRIDIILINFFYALDFRPDSRLHFFGNVEASELISEFPDYKDLILNNCLFYGFNENAWTLIKEKLNPIHLVASEWEDPGHAILEGLWNKVPTVFLNKGGNYIDLYESYGVVIKKALEFDKETFNEMIDSASNEQLRSNLKKELASQFTISRVKSKLNQLLDV